MAGYFWRQIAGPGLLVQSDLHGELTSIQRIGASPRRVGRVLTLVCTRAHARSRHSELPWVVVLRQDVRQTKAPQELLDRPASPVRTQAGSHTPGAEVTAAGGPAAGLEDQQRRRTRRWPDREGELRARRRGWLEP